MDKNITKKIVEIIANRTGIAKEEITPEADLVKDLNIPRIEIPDIFMAIENELSIQLPQDKIQEVITVEHIINLVSDRLM